MLIKEMERGLAMREGKEGLAICLGQGGGSGVE